MGKDSKIAWTERPILFSGDMVSAILRGTKTVTRRPVDMAKLRVRLPSTIRADWPFESHATAKPGLHRCGMNQHGAVWAELGDKQLGLKPGEFHFVCPFADGDTHLGDFGKGRKEWVITPRESKLWVRETWCAVDIRGEGAATIGDVDQERGVLRFRADYNDHIGSQLGRGGRWFPSIHMPRWASRLSLDVVSVRLEHVQAITEADARAEGIDPENLGYMFGNPDRGQECRGAFAYRWIKRYGLDAWAQNRWVWRIEFRKAAAP